MLPHVKIIVAFFEENLAATLVPKIIKIIFGISVIIDILPYSA
jgi:hypothetical protein